jgi:hypothetical protein
MSALPPKADIARRQSDVRALRETLIGADMNFLVASRQHFSTDCSLEAKPTNMWRDPTSRKPICYETMDHEFPWHRARTITENKEKIP